MIRTMNLVTPQNGAAPYLVEPADMGAHNEANLGAHSLESVRVLDVDGALYVLHPSSGRGPVATFDVAAVLAEEEAIDAAIAALPPVAREKLVPGWEPLPVKRAKRAADDAEAEVRRLTAAKADEAELDAAIADAEAKRAAADALLSGDDEGEDAGR
jgi:hypothetical protein